MPHVDEKPYNPYVLTHPHRYPASCNRLQDLQQSIYKRVEMLLRTKTLLSMDDIASLGDMYNTQADAHKGVRLHKYAAADFVRNASWWN